MADLNSAPELKRNHDTERFQRIVNELSAAADELVDVRKHAGVQAHVEFYLKSYRCTLHLEGRSELELLPRLQTLTGLLAAAGAKGVTGGEI